MRAAPQHDEAKLFQPFNYNAVKLKGFDMIVIDKWMTTWDMDHQGRLALIMTRQFNR